MSELGSVVLSPFYLLISIARTAISHFSRLKRSEQRAVTKITAWSKRAKHTVISKLHAVQRSVVRILRLTERSIRHLRTAIRRWMQHVVRLGRANLKKIQRFIRKHAPSSRTYKAIAIGIGAGMISLLTIRVGQHIQSLPNPTTSADFSKPAATLIYDRNGVLLYSAYDDTYRVPISLSDLPSIVIEATLEAEDERFYEHAGIDPRAIVRAFSNNLQGNPTQGASTITQQLARLAFLSQDRTWTRKFDEMILAFKIENNFEKHQILELYFNTVPYGSVAVGIEAAAQHYFHKSASELTPTEALFLATLTPAPSVYGEIARANPEEYTRVKQLAIKLHATQKITDAELQTILSDTLHFAPRASYKRAPHVVDAVLSEIVKQYGEEQLLQSGALVQTTIDLSLQNQVQQLVLEEVMTQGLIYDFSNAAVVVSDPKTGEILAMIGSANYYDQDSGQVNVAEAERQLGSTLKLIPYSLALEQGKLPTDTIVDEPVVFSEYDNYQPRNYDGSFHGSVTLAQAFANSYNIPALKLTHELGVEQVANHAARMGITEYAALDKPAPLSLAIGSVETSLVHLSQAYQVVAAGGIKRELHLIESISNHAGQTVYSHQATAEPILSATTAAQISEILRDPQLRAAAFGSPIFFDFASDAVSIKTGTSNDLKDNVAVAFTDSLLVSVWTGNNSGAPMSSVASGFTGATPIMHKTTSLLLERESEVIQVSSRN